MPFFAVVPLSEEDTTEHKDIVKPIIREGEVNKLIPIAGVDSFLRATEALKSYDRGLIIKEECDTVAWAIAMPYLTQPLNAVGFRQIEVDNEPEVPVDHYVVPVGGLEPPGQ